MRDGFRAIVGGWTLIKDAGALAARIDRAGTWTKANSPLQRDEHDTVKYMIECQISLAAREGKTTP